MFQYLDKLFEKLKMYSIKLVADSMFWILSKYE